MAQTNWNFADFDFTKMLQDAKIPGFDLNAVMATQKRNFDALTEANRRAAAGFQSIAKRQAEIFQDSIKELSAASKDALSGASPEANAAKQAELAKKVLDRALANAREIAEMATKANAETFDIINKRALEGMEELKQFGSKPKVAAKA
jgi:phasin family protein